MTPLPAFYDDLDASLAEVWRLLADGVEHGRSGFHLVTLATAAAGFPRVRTVVLRSAEGRAGLLRFHCDRRSDKARELAVNPACALAAYDAAAKIQIRIEGRATLHTDDALADAVWAASRPMSRVCYAAEPAPGTVLPSGDAYTLPDEDTATVSGRPSFCAVQVEAQRLDFLYLDRRGHRRAAWQRDGAGWAGAWLAP